MFAAFQANPTSTVSISATDASGASRQSIGSTGNQLLVVNSGGNLCYVKLGDVTVTAATTDMPLLPQSAMILTKGSATYVAAICDSGLTTTLKATPGNGF